MELDAATRADLEAIRADAQSGAVELADRAAEVIIRLSDSWETGETSFRPALASACRAVIAAQPSMASLLNLCNAVLHAADSEDVIYLRGKPQPSTAPQRAANAAMRFRAFLAHHARRIANEALPYIRSGALLLTHSHSGTVFAALARAHGAGKRFGVVCTESRPQFDGVQMARRLAAIGIEVEVIADAAAATFVNGFYTVLVGADAVTRDGAVNKIGTLGLAFAAKQVGVPFYCFAGTEKFLPPGAPFEIAERDPAEIVPSDANLHGFNLYFDQTPLDLISKLFTEDGPLTPDQVRARLAAQTLHAALVTEATA